MKLRQEVQKYLPEKTSKLTTESLNNMPYMRAVLKEALRISPVLAGNARQAGRDIVLDGYQVPKGVSEPLTLPPASIEMVLFSLLSHLKIDRSSNGHGCSAKRSRILSKNGRIYT